MIRLQHEIMVWKHLKEFGQETTIHGLSHVTGDSIPTSRKLTWVIILIFSFMYAGSMLKSAFEGKMWKSF